MINHYNNKIINHNKIFQEIKKSINEKALITLSRIFNATDNIGHSYSVLGAWEITRGKIKKQVLCIKNPWISGDNKQENFNLQSLSNSIKDSPELIELIISIFVHLKKYFLIMEINNLINIIQFLLFRIFNGTRK